MREWQSDVTEGAATARQTPVRPGQTPQRRTLAWASAIGNRAVQRAAKRQLQRLTPAEILKQYQVERG